MTDPTQNLLDNAVRQITSLEQKVKDLEEQLKSVQSGGKIAQEKIQRDQTRLTKSSGKDISKDEGRLGENFELTENPSFLETRLRYFDELFEKQKAKLMEMPRESITITLPDGSTLSGTSFETSPLEIATNISPGLAKSSLIAKVFYSSRKGTVDSLGGGFDEDEGVEEKVEGELWDMARPLEGDCKLQLLKFDDDEAKMVFWHSAAHLMGECLECKLGAHLTVGPPVQPGFYYDSFIGDNGISEKTLKELETLTEKKAKEKQKFERLVLSKEEALEMFKYNPYKLSIIRNKVKDNEKTSVYRNGPFIDLCLGPHIVDTGSIKAVMLKQATTAYWLGHEDNDKLQRVHGIAFPEKKLLKEYKEMVALASENDHRKRGLEQELFFFDPLSPGSCFWKPHGAKIFNKLVSWIQQKNRENGYQEVITPNVYSVDLWKKSGHWQHYQKNMFCFSDGEHEDNLFALKPMNCPGHCIVFDSSVRSYRDLPLRMADFGVLHRNEASGALGGLTRVRRFQQDDAHIFCRKDQVKDEVLSALKYVKEVYDVLGLSMSVGRSTRPSKAVGLLDEDGNVDEKGVKKWDDAEAQLATALDAFVGKGKWKDNPGDGAFYGPKIDIDVFDALKRKHQCATIQLDFQTPHRFNLKYSSDHVDKEEGKSNLEQPVMIHRAILGSIERMSGILTEHFMGKWPFWLSPRQIKLIPVNKALNEHVEELQKRLFRAGFEVEVDISTKTLNKKILLAQKEQFNFMFVVGDKEKENDSVNVRTRRNTKLGEKKVDDMIAMLKKYQQEKYLDEVVDPKQQEQEQS